MTREQEERVRRAAEEVVRLFFEGKPPVDLVAPVEALRTALAADAAPSDTLDALDVERLAAALRSDVVQDVIRRWMPTDQTSHVAIPLAAEYARLASATPSKPEP